MTAVLFGLWLGIQLPTAEAGIFRHRKVQSVEVTLDTGRARAGEVIPGQPIPITVTLVDDRGNRRTTDGVLPRSVWRKLEVTVDGGRFKPDTAVVVPSPARERSAE